MISSFTSLAWQVDKGAGSSLEHAHIFASEASNFLTSQFESSGYRVLIGKLNHAVGVLIAATLNCFASPDADVSNQATLMSLAEELANGGCLAHEVSRHGAYPNGTIDLRLFQVFNMLEIVNKHFYVFNLPSKVNLLVLREEVTA